MVRARAPFEQLAALSWPGAGAGAPTGQLTEVRPDTEDLLGSGSRVRPRTRWALAVLAVAVVGLLLTVSGIIDVGGGRPASTAAAPTGLPEPGQTEFPTQLPTVPPSATAAPRAVSGRLTDDECGLSYTVLPGKWQAWDGVRFDGFVSMEGYYRVVQQDAPGGSYWANVTSGLVLPAASDELKGAAEQLINRLDTNYYPKHTRRDASAKAITVDRHKAYLIQYVAVFDRAAAAGYKAKSEQVTLLVVDTGRGLPAALYLSLPDLVHSLWPSTASVIKSVKVLPR